LKDMLLAQPSLPAAQTLPVRLWLATPFTVSGNIPRQCNYMSLPPEAVTLAGTTAADFVTAFSAAVGLNPSIAPYVSASINSSGAIVFTHSAGGQIAVEQRHRHSVTSAGFTTSTEFVRNAPNNALYLSYWVGFSNLCVYF
jgi:hypothetical protein